MWHAVHQEVASKREDHRTKQLIFRTWYGVWVRPSTQLLIAAERSP